MAGQVRHEVSDHADRADPWPAAAMGNAEGLMQIEVADITAEVARFGGADQGVHVRAVDVDPAAVLVDDFAELFDFSLKDAVGAWVGDHHCGQLIAELLALLPQFCQIDIALRVAANHHHLHPGHLGTRRVRAVG